MRVNASATENTLSATMSSGRTMNGSTVTLGGALAALTSLFSSPAKMEDVSEVPPCTSSYDRENLVECQTLHIALAQVASRHATHKRQPVSGRHPCIALAQ